MSATARTSIYVGYHGDEVAKAKELLVNQCARFDIKNYTIYDAEGYWNGKHEFALIIDIIGDDSDLTFALDQLARVLRYNMQFGQEAVYIVRSLIDLVVV